MNARKNLSVYALKNPEELPCLGISFPKLEPWMSKSLMAVINVSSEETGN